MNINHGNRKIWPNAMRESFFEKVTGGVLFKSTSTETVNEFRESTHVPRVLGSRFPVRTHVLDSIEVLSNRFSHFYFSKKIMFFRKFLKILENPWISAHTTYPRWVAAAHW